MNFWVIMVTSIQFHAKKPSIASPEPYNPDQGIVYTGQIFSSILRISETPELLLTQVRETNLTLREMEGNLAALLERQSQSGGPATVEVIKAAIKEGTPLDVLFASDPENFGIDLAQSTMRVQALQRAGLAIDAHLYYPVIIISTDENNLQIESLLWMTEAERLALDIYPVAEEKDYAPYLARSRSEESQVTRYVFLDDQANLRIDSNALNDAISQVNRLVLQKRSSISAGLIHISNELAGIGLLLDWLTHAIDASFKNKSRAMDLKRMEVEEEMQLERTRFIQLARVKSDIEDLDEAKSDLLLNLEGDNE